MKSCIAYIHSYPGAAAALAMLWPGFKKLELSLIGVECDGEPTVWPEPIPTIDAGINAYATADPYNLPSRLVLTLKHFLTTEFERCIVMEYDTLILGPIPDYPSGFVAKHFLGVIPGSEATQFFHTPWLFDRESAETVIRVGMELMMDGTVGRGGWIHGSPDMFLGLIVDRSGMKFTDSGTFTKNTIHSPEDITLARQAVADGVWFLHGVKSREVLDAILA